MLNKNADNSGISNEEQYGDLKSPEEKKSLEKCITGKLLSVLKETGL